MKKVGAYEAKTHLPALLEKVSKGERITITRHGVPIALLIPAGPSQKAPTTEIIAKLKKFKMNRKLGSVSLKSLKEEGRR